MMVQLHADALLFDLDGTLISTIKVTEHIYTTHSTKHNVDARKVLGYCHGVPTLQVLRKYFPAHTHTNEYAEQLERESAELLDGIAEIQGAGELLKTIPEDKWAIFTSGMPFLAVPRMQYLAMPVPAVFVTPVDVANGKPAPDGYKLAARQLSADPAKCLVFEDAVAGIRAGVAAGAVVVGVRTHLSAEQLRAAGARCTVADMSKVSVDRRGDSLLVTIDEQ
ncbi:hypothetical protein IWW52_000780 [Coemansia sp. RSA 2704]|nr:hypothetical protein IWW54_001954 [Coemansia sp. RSA 2705]KAJ2321383.1 hypothetical protein IWW52_000780 [Coemansia sp. RSA 2704]